MKPVLICRGLRSQHFVKMHKLLWPKTLPPRGKNVALCRFTDVAFTTCLLNKIEDSIYTCG